MWRVNGEIEPFSAAAGRADGLTADPRWGRFWGLVTNRRCRATAVALMMAFAGVKTSHAQQREVRQLAADTGSGEPGGVTGKQPVAELRLDWRASATCFEANEFQTRVSQLTPRVQWRADSTQVVAVTMSEHGQLAVIEWFIDGGATWRREIPGRWDCETLARALAFALAVKLDPDATSVEAPGVSVARAGRGVMHGAIDGEMPGAVDGAMDGVEPSPAPDDVSERGRPLETSVVREVSGAAKPPPKTALPSASMREVNVAQRATSARAGEHRPNTPSDVFTSPTESASSARWRELWAGIGPALVAGIGDRAGFGASAIVALREPGASARALSSAWRWLGDIGIGASYLGVEEGVGAIGATANVWAGDLRVRPIAWAGEDATWFIETGVTLGSLSVRAENVAVASPVRTLWAATEASLGVQFAVDPTTFDLTLGASWQLAQPRFLVQRSVDDVELRQVLAIPGPAFVARLRIFLPVSRSESSKPDIGRLE